MDDKTAKSKIYAPFSQKILEIHYAQKHPTIGRFCFSNRLNFRSKRRLNTVLPVKPQEHQYSSSSRITKRRSITAPLSYRYRGYKNVCSVVRVGRSVVLTCDVMFAVEDVVALF